MKLKRLLDRVNPSSPSNRRSSDFQPLGSFDAYDSLDSPHPKAKHDFQTRPMFTNKGSLDLTSDGRNRQPPIELKSLSARDMNKSKALGQNASHKIDFCRADTQSFQIPDDQDSPAQFIVYNATTSEELPPDLCPDEGLPASLRNARLTLSNLISGEGNINGSDNTKYVTVPGNVESPPRRRRSPYLENIREFCCQRASLKESVTVISSTIVIFLGIALVLMVVLGKINYGLDTKDSKESVDPDLEALLQQSWPLPDLKSTAQNISFAPIEEKLKLFNLDNEGETKPNITNITYYAEVNPRRGHFYTLGGEIIDPVIVNASYNFAKRIFTSQLNPNGSEAETLALKGMAGSIFLLELRRRMDEPKYDRLPIQGFIPDDLCNAKVDRSYNRLNHEHCEKEAWYREFDGKCNNIKYPYRGGLYSPLRRIIEPEYHSLEINSHDHLKLPDNKRNHGQSNQEKVDKGASALLPIWGIFVLHDTLNVAEAPGRCCSEDDHLPPGYSESLTDFVFNYARFYINDSKSSICYENVADHEKFNDGKRWVRKCSALPPPAIYPACDASELRSSFNLVTSYIDASNIYGSSKEISNSLRTNKQGKLKVQKGKDGKGLGFLLLQNKTKNESCFHKQIDTSNNSKCLLTGDAFIHENSLITGLHTIFVRQHNWIAFWLRQYNRHWDDGRIFQETRKIVIAQIQHITFNEFLPAILGNNLINSTGLKENSSVFYELYEKEVDPTPSTAFAYASKLVFYSMLGSRAKMLWKNGKRKQEFWVDMGSLWFQADKLSLGRRKHLLESLLEGFSLLNARQAGLHFSSKIRSLYSKVLNKTLNLPEMLYERGQALDVPGYMSYRKICGLRELKEPKDFNDAWTPEALEWLTKWHRHLEDVDLITGLLAEKSIPSGRVGPTMACIMLDQFQRFRRGDRYWWEGDIYFQHFSLEQINTIRESTLARIICDNTDENLDRIQKWPMLLPNSTSNPILSCHVDKMPRLKFELWKEKNEHNPNKKFEIKDKKEATSESEDDDVLGLFD